MGFVGTAITSQLLVPRWSKPAHWSLGRDPLGMQATSVRMYRSLVPGLTNVTNRLRYYSYYCWVVSLWAQIRHVDDEHEWRLFIRRAEALYALACESVEANTHGLAGSDWARRYWAGFSGSRIDLVPHTNQPGKNGQYLMAKRGNFGQFYVASMLEVKLLGESARIPIVARAGKELAAAFAVAIGEQTAAELASTINSGKLSKSDLQRFGEAIHPSRLKANSREMTLLRDFLWPKSLTTAGSKARRTSAWLLLDLSRKGVSIFDENAVRRAFYQRTLPDGTLYCPGGSVIERWRAFQANELCHIALEALLNALTAALFRHVEGIEPAKLIADLIKHVVPTRQRDVAWSDWAIAASDGVPDAEEALSREVLDGLKRYKERAEDRKMLLAATKLLGVLWHKWGSSEEPVRDEVALFSVGGGTSLAGVLTTLKETTSLTVAEALENVVRRHVIADHLAIAGRKLAIAGKYTYRFVLENGLLSDGWVAEYGYTNPRLRNLATFLVDAKLADVDGSVTATGLSLVNEFQPT